MNYIIQLPPRTAASWQWEAYKTKAALKGLVIEVQTVSAIIGKRKPAGSIARAVREGEV